MSDTEGSHPDELPALYTYWSDAAGFWKHQRHFLTNKWPIMVRPATAGAEPREVAMVRGAKAAAQAFQQARMTDCSDGHVIEMLKPVLGGWFLADRAGRLDGRNTFETKPGQIVEQVWGQNGELIAAIRLHRPQQWHIWVCVSNSVVDGAEFEQPKQYDDFVHGTRDAALAAAQRLVPDAVVGDGDDWLEEWTTRFGRLHRAGVATSFTHNMDILGPTGTTCAAPGCDQEALMRITRSGPDAITTSRMVCPDHGGQVLAHHAPPP